MEPTKERYQSQSSTIACNSISDRGIPRIPLNLRDHKIPLAITTTILVFGNGILPVALFYILKYGGHTSNVVAIVVPSVIFGGYSMFAMYARTWSLLKKNSTTRPIGASRKHLDFFQVNFIALFIALTAMISAGSALASDEVKWKIALRIVAMSLPVLMVCVCMQLMAIFIAISLKPASKYPFRISSMTKGEVARPASYTITEDVVAVDGKQGTAYRIQLDDRYRSSEDIRALFRWADAAWGFSGVTLGVVLIVIIWVVPNENVGFVLGWILPWVWASVFTFMTVRRTQSALAKENQRHHMHTSKTEPNV